MTNTLEMRKSNLVLPTSGYQLDREEMSYVEGGDFFVGINLSASFCYGLTQWVPLGVKTGGIGLGSLGAIAMGIPQISAIMTPLLASVSAALASIPVLGWVAIGILAAAVLTVLGTALYAGSTGKGFKFGLDVKTGFLGLPTAVNFVCGIGL